jgi:uncharacterized protein YqiB (DUF1249 family)
LAEVLLKAPFVDPSGYVDFVSKHYLTTHIKEGGAKVKFIVGLEGSGKTTLLNHIGDEARDLGYCVVALDVSRVRLGRFDEVYRAIAAQIQFDGLVRELCEHEVIIRLGYRPEDIPESQKFVEWLGHQDKDRTWLRREVKEELQRLYRDANLTDSFATAFIALAQDYLGQPVPAENLDTARRWLKGESLQARTLRRVFLHRSVDRYSARHTLRSLLFLLKRLEHPGLVVTIDGLETLVSKARQPDRVRYTRMQRDDAYESLREIIDDTENMPGLFVIGAARPQFFADNSAGIRSYEALDARVQNEIAADEVNRFADMFDLDEAWQAGGSWPEHRERLAAAWQAYVAEKGHTQEPCDISRYDYLGLVSPVKLIVDNVFRRGGE